MIEWKLEYNIWHTKEATKPTSAAGTFISVEALFPGKNVAHILWV
jgi:hypothetical protein